MKESIPPTAEQLDADMAWAASIGRGVKEGQIRVQAVKQHMARNASLRRHLLRMVRDWKRWAGITTTVFQRPREQKLRRKPTRLSRRTGSTRGDPEPGAESAPNAVVPTAVGEVVQGAGQLVCRVWSGRWFA